jgi:hypothetical protein
MTKTHKAGVAKPRGSARKAVVAAQTRRDPDAWEQRAFPAAREKQHSFTEPATVKIGDASVDPPHTDIEGYQALLAAALGSRSPTWITSSINSLILTSHPKSATAPQEDRINTALAFMSDIAPQNTVEAALGMQMLATHDMAIEMLRRVRHADMLPQMEAYGNLATKLSRTFTSQMEALAKLRRGGEQVVKYIHVHEGGQAVVAGTINQGAGGSGIGKGDVQPHEQGTSGTALPCPDPIRDGMPFASDAERAVSPTRRPKSGGAGG